MKDKLEEIFEKQEEFMQLLEEHDMFPPWPIDLTTKQGQRMAKEIAGCMHDELWEACHTLKNKMHRLTDDRSFDRAHYEEELGDTLAFFIELCIATGVTADRIHNQFIKKNRMVKERFENGY